MTIVSDLCSASRAVSSAGLTSEVLLGLVVEGVISVREVVSGFLVFHPGSLSL